uniref:Glutathione S-transferase omega n=1 Tax=Laticauda laticaudata TaxID=8630 RepID=A0A8C5WWS7_LATLA
VFPCRFLGNSMKMINHEIVNINLRNKSDWFFEKNPHGMVPVLETSKGQLIYESPITCEYLDEAYPEKKLYPADPYDKAYQKMLFNYIRAFRNGEDASALKNEFQEELLKLDEVLSNHKTKFFGGDSISMIDYLIWPWFERMEAFQLTECLDHTPGLKSWVDLMKLDPAVQAKITDPQIFKGFLELHFNNSIEACDYGL